MDVESTYVHPQWPAIQLLHCLLAIAGSLLATELPIAGFSLVLFATLSLYLDLTGRAYLLRRLFFRRASQNVVAPPAPDREEEPRDRVLLTANYDAPLTGAAYNPGSSRAFERFLRLWPARTSPQAVIFWSMALLLPPLGARMAGLESDWLAVIQLLPTMVLIVAAFMLGEIGLSPLSPGANGNASGVAAALRTRQLLADESLRRLQVHVLLAGGGETTSQGLRNFLRRHRRELPRDRTWVLALDSAGIGEPRYVTLEVPALAQSADRTLIELGEALSAGQQHGDGALRLGPASAAGMAGSLGYPAIALTAREEGEFTAAGHHTPADRPSRLSVESIEAVAELAADMVRLLDRDLARRGGREPGADPDTGREPSPS